MDNVRNSHLQNYIDQNLRLIRTLSIKHIDLAYLANEQVAAVYGTDAIDTNDKTSWKYFLNVAGQYHFSDTMMRVVSIDTLEEIDFTAENLAIHTATALAYQVGTRDYFLLTTKYPSQIRLIHGILYPCDIYDAIDAVDGTILSYQRDLVEDSEETLIYDLESYVKNALSRWYITAFNSSNELYAATYFAALTTQLFQKLLNLREARCHTREAHSFHIRMFLASHNKLDDYIPYMTRKQVMWLYRNIRYIERNFGNAEQLKTLIHHILTERSIPIAEYKVRQTDEFNGYSPGVIAKNRSLNGLGSSLAKDSHALSLLFEKEIPDAPGNEKYLEYRQPTEEQRFVDSNSGIVQTKALLSSMVDYTNAVPEPFDTVAVRQWCYMSVKSLYYANIVYRDPKTSEQQSLSAKNAFIYFLYATIKTYGFDIQTIPDFLNVRQRKRPKPTVEHLLAVVPAERRKVLEPIAKQILSRQPMLGPCISVTAFHSQIEKLYEEAYWHWCLMSATEDLNDRAYVECMVSRLYEDEMVVLSETQTTFENWRISLNLPEFEYDYSETVALSKNLFAAATGISVDSTKRLANIQRALINLLKQLSSYSIQILREINESDLLIENWPAVRFSEPKTTMTVVRKDEVGPRAYYINSHASVTLDIATNPATVTNCDIKGINVTQEIQFDPIADVVQTAVLRLKLTDISSPTQITGSYQGQDVELDNREGVLGFTTFDKLTQAQKLRLKSKF